MRELIRGYAAATFETAEQKNELGKLASDLSGFSRVLTQSSELRHVLTDASIPVIARRDVVSDLLSNKVTPQTAALISFVIRVERAGELPSAIAALVAVVEEVVAQPTGSSVDESSTARLVVRERIRGYAERVLQELSALGEVDEVEDELFRFARLLDDHSNLRQALSDSNSSYELRAGIVSDLLGEKVSSVTLRLARYVLRAGSSRDLVGTFEWLVELAAEERGRRVAEVRSAVDLDSTEQERLSVALERLVERPVETRVIIDPSVIGGVLISVGDLVIDGTVRIRFERLRDSLAEAS